MEDSRRYKIMPALRRLLWVLAWGISAACQAVETQSGQPPPQSQRMMPGQLIVKFTDGSAAHQVYVRALAAGTNSAAQLAGLTARLSAELGIPLTIEQLTSGQEFIISIDVDTLMEKLVEYLNTRTDIKQARLLDTGNSTEPLYHNPVVVVDFKPDSTMGQALTRDPEVRREAAHSFAAEVGKSTAIPVSAQLPQTLELVVDMSTVTTHLLQRLKRRPDVEYAQLNVMVQPYSGGMVKPVE